MSTLVEKVEEEISGKYSWLNSQARGAIATVLQEMMEPSEAMYDGARCYNNTYVKQVSKEVYCAMIRAFAKEHGIELGETT